MRLRVMITGRETKLAFAPEVDSYGRHAPVSRQGGNGQRQQQEDKDEGRDGTVRSLRAGLGRHGRYYNRNKPANWKEDLRHKGIYIDRTEMDRGQEYVPGRVSFARENR